MPKEKCTAKYKHLDDDMRPCLNAGRGIYITKSDIKSAFQNLPIKPDDWKWLIMMAIHQISKKRYFFTEKYLPFGASISCSHFQRASDAIEWIFHHRTGKKAVNYLDDFFFVTLQQIICNWLVEQFLGLCKEIRMPISLEKTEWAMQVIIFLGMLLNIVTQSVSIPIEKRDKTLVLLNNIIRSKKTTVLKMQQMAGLLNFFARCIVPAQPYNHRFYQK